MAPERSPGFTPRTNTTSVPGMHGPPYPRTRAARGFGMVNLGPQTEMARELRGIFMMSPPYSPVMYALRSSVKQSMQFHCSPLRTNTLRLVVVVDFTLYYCREHRTSMKRHLRVEEVLLDVQTCGTVNEAGWEGWRRLWSTALMFEHLRLNRFVWTPDVTVCVC